MLINNTWTSHKEKVIRQELDEPEKGLIFKVLSQSSNFSPRSLKERGFIKVKGTKGSVPREGSRTSELEGVSAK